MINGDENYSPPFEQKQDPSSIKLFSTHLAKSSTINSKHELKTLQRFVLFFEDFLVSRAKNHSNLRFEGYFEQSD